MKLSILEIYQAARAAGFTPDQATTWTAIALAESGGQTGALNDRGEHSVGLWQINVAPNVRENSWGDLHDPLANARAAYDISRQGTDMRPWTTTHASRAGTAADYRTYLDDVSAVTGYRGDPRGVEGYGSPLPPPLPPSGPADDGLTSAGLGLAAPAGYDQMDLGAVPGSGLDTDQDGLTDAFERLTGSSPDVADTDRDGLSDSYERLVSHTDPMLADTDADSLGDANEIALGTSPTTWDSDADGASDGAEARYGTDPLRAEHGTVPTSQPGAMPGAMPGAVPAAMPGAAPISGSGPAVAATATSATTATNGGGTLADAFVRTAVAQRGDSYVFGAEASLDDPDPDTWDCSELVQWAGHQVGLEIPDGAMYQYLDLKSQGQLVPVEEALRTKGALLFYFSSEPTAGGSRPGQAHVAISLGDGRTIEARGSSYGVNEFSGAGRFNYAGIIPGMGAASTATAPAFGPEPEGPPTGAVVDSDNDGLSDEFERMLGLDPESADSDRDGIPDAQEQLAPQTVARDALLAASVTNVAATADGAGPGAGVDTDRDGLSDSFELSRGLDPTSADTDHDGLTDSIELALGTDPTTADSDLDGLTDKLELEYGSDPLDASSTPGAAGGSLDHPAAHLPDTDLTDTGLELG